MFIDDMAGDEDEGEDGAMARAEDGGEEDEDEGEENVAGLIAEKAEKEKIGQHLAASATLRQTREQEEDAELAAAEERYARLGANYAREGGRDSEYYEPGEFGEAAIAARVEAAKLEREREKAARAEAARLAAEEAARQQKRSAALADLYDLYGDDGGSSSNGGAVGCANAASTTSAAAAPASAGAAAAAPAVAAAASGAKPAKYRIGKKPKAA